MCPRPHLTGFPCSQLCRDRGLHKYEVLQDSLTPESRCHSADLPSRPASVSAMREADPSEEAVKKKATAQLVSRRSTCIGQPILTTSPRPPSEVLRRGSKCLKCCELQKAKYVASRHTWHTLSRF